MTGADPVSRPLLILIPQPATRRFHLGFGVGAAGPGRVADALARLEFLVDKKEVLDLEPVELGQVMQVAQVLLSRWRRRTPCSPTLGRPG